MHLLHVHDRIGAMEAAMLAALMDALGADARHTIASAMPVAPDLRRRIGETGARPAFAIAFPPLSGRTALTRLRAIARALGGFDLVLTHGYGAIDAGVAHTLFAQALRLPPLVHHEERSDPARSRRRDWYRRVALGRTAALIVPSERLRATALGAWQQPPSRVRLVPPGADIAALGREPRRDALPRLIKRKGERWLGVLADQPAAVPLDALPRLADAWQLIAFADTGVCEAVRAAAAARALAHRVHTLDAAMLTDALGLLDLVAFASSDVSPEAIVAAMAAGRAIIPPADAGARELLSSENAAEAGMTIARLAGDDALRRRIGAANQVMARARYDLRDILAQRIAIYRDAALQGPHG